jgi:EAL domain-containing protein (putative c-di-GMP-specific phosphodiesterase class I)/CheY-like chemotaxis protein
MGAGERSVRVPSFTRNELREAIEHGGIEVRLQPLVSIRSGVVTRLEALARWQHPHLGPVPPATFVPFAERVGLVGPLMARVVREALRGLVGWRERLPDLRVAVNISALTLEDAGLPEFLAQVLDEAGCAPACLGIEITESTLMAEPDLAHRTLSALRALGVRIDVDDFGTGYSSLGRLAELPLDAVKIDREFVTPMTRDHRREAIVRAIIALGHDLGFEVVAEGVEDIETWEQLAAHGCDTAQGYHIARPMAPEAVSEWLVAWESGLAFMRRERIGERIVAYQRPGPADVGERAVLVVDDEPSILQVIRDILEHEGFRVLTAANGTEALKLVERNRPLVVLLDMSMPTLDGAGFTAELRERGLRVPIVVMTAGPSAERWARELRADGFLTKPFEMSGLLDIANRFAEPLN